MKPGNPFQSVLVSPVELQLAISHSTASPRRIIPVAAGRQSTLGSYQENHIPGSMYTATKASAKLNGHFWADK
jgi:thiosulfate/3-mercaptopyruvate sulfurtransferase